MTENEAIKILDAEKRCLDKSTKGLCKTNCGDCKENIPIAYQEKAYEVAISALKEIQQYREMDRKLREVYGDCEGLLEKAVFLLCDHEGVDVGNPIKARLLTDEDVDKWEAYKSIGTVEECREAVEKFDKAEKALNVILSGNYNDECNFCVHNDNPMANCQCISGDGSWCIHNAKWNGKTSEDGNLEGMEDE